MKIKRSSWHYKISNLGDFEKRNDNLCNYFWRIVGKLALFFIMAVLLFGIGFTYFTSPAVIPNTILLLWLFGSVILPPLVIGSIRERLGGPAEIKGESIVKEFIKAKKNRFCPMIKYVD